MSTPTVALYYSDDYAREMDAELREVRPDGLVLDRTVFYPRGGNQDCDTGSLAQRDAPYGPPRVLCRRAILRVRSRVGRALTRESDHEKESKRAR